MDLDVLNQPQKIGQKTAPNRLAIHPMECNDADEKGNPSQLTMNRYRKLAQGGAGLISVESATINPSSRARDNQLVAQKENTQGLAKLIEVMRAENPDPLIIIQINHSGAISGPGFSKVVSYYPTGFHKEEVIIGDDELRQISGWYVEAAKVCQAAGADGIDFKMCHGYLGGQLLRPANTRQGRYGGSWENRSRFFVETAARIKDETNDPGFILGSRISFYEGIPGGFGTSGPDQVVEDPTEPLAFCKLIEDAGFHFINVSGGVPVMTGEFCRPTKRYPEGVYRQFGWAKQVRQAVGIPLIGTAYSYLRDGDNQLVESDKQKKSLIYWACNNIKSGQVEMVGIGRQSLADPLFPKKVLSGDLDNIDYCMACSGCSKLLGGQARVGCVVYDDFYKNELKQLRAAK
jgi:2,4-dienoyl-CoA reductase-like NADH-dependent reductase (Old Yellow Enzyme family)